MRPERLLRFLDDADPSGVPAKLRSFEWVFVVSVVAELWCRALARWDRVPMEFLVFVGVASVCGPLALLSRSRRIAFLILSLNYFGVLWYEFPASANHTYLQLVYCLLAATLRCDDQEEAALYLRAVRWTAVVVLFFSGVQKLVHGFYFQAEYLSFALRTESYRMILAPLLPQAELERLLSYTKQIGDGPYRTHSPLFLLASNATYVLEIGFALLLLLPATRTLAAIGTILFMAVIEVGARELFFGLTFINALLLYLPGTAHRRVAPLMILMSTVLLLIALGILPRMRFT